MKSVLYAAVTDVLGDFQQRFSTASCPVFAWWTFPQREETGWGVVPPAAGWRRGRCPRSSPSNLPPAGGGNGHEGHSF
jgi:hypothetical protein